MKKNIEQVIEIEKQAQAVSEAAIREAEKLPLLAQEEAQALLENTRREAEKEAQHLLDGAHAEEECARILDEAQKQADQTKGSARQHLDQAINFVVERVTGKI